MAAPVTPADIAKAAALSALPVCVVVALDVVIAGTNTWVSLAAAGVWLVAVVYLVLHQSRG